MSFLILASVLHTLNHCAVVSMRIYWVNNSLNSLALSLCIILSQLDWEAQAQLKSVGINSNLWSLCWC